MASTKKGTGKGKMIAAAGLASAVAAAGAYLFAGPEGAKHRKKVMTLAAKAKNEIMKLEKEIQDSVKKAQKKTS